METTRRASSGHVRAGSWPPQRAPRVRRPDERSLGRTGLGDSTREAPIERSFMIRDGNNGDVQGLNDSALISVFSIDYLRSAMGGGKLIAVIFLSEESLAAMERMNAFGSSGERNLHCPDATLQNSARRRSM